jgi:polysaccharide export outer membrane protein
VRPIGALAVISLAVSACSSVSGSYVWVDAYPLRPEAAKEALVIKPGDVIDVRVLNQDQVSGKARVRSDGKVALPFLNEVQAAGMAPGALAQDLQARFKSFFTTPVVTVSVEEAKPRPISVMGQVERPGQYALDNASTVLQALALAGGLTEFAKNDRIFVLRAGPPQERIRFRYEALVQPRGPAASFRLQGGDVVVVD